MCLLATRPKYRYALNGIGGVLRATQIQRRYNAAHDSLNQDSGKKSDGATQLAPEDVVKAAEAASDYSMPEPGTIFTLRSLNKLLGSSKLSVIGTMRVEQPCSALTACHRTEAMRILQS